MRVFFGHQSVGENLLAGMRELGVDATRPIIAADTAAVSGGPALLHARLGENGNPQSKIDHFVALMRGATGVDVAMMKFCYVDFSRNRDPLAVLDAYRKAILALQRDHPRLRIAHVTVPLKRMPLGPRAVVRRLLRRPEGILQDNLCRNRFNAELRRCFAGTPVFDLASVEATRPGGRRASRRWRGEMVDGLAPELTDDGGHLNAAGRRAGAEALEGFLSGL